MSLVEHVEESGNVYELNVYTFNKNIMLAKTINIASLLTLGFKQPPDTLLLNSDMSICLINSNDHV